jgi:hypothetical protein
MVCGSSALVMGNSETKEGEEEAEAEIKKL